MKKKRRGKYVVISLLVIVPILAGVIIYQILNPVNSLEYEENVMVGLMPGVDRDALLASLQANTDNSAVAFSINAMPTVVGTSMDLFFENPAENEKDIQLTIYEDETGEEIYKSKAIRGGNYLSTVTLLKEFEPGSYAATAQIIALDTETHEQIGETAAGLTLVVVER
jgi:hypothetical protein